MPQVLLVEIAKVWIQAVAIEVDIFFRIARTQPGVLHRDVFVGDARRQFAFLFLWLFNPIVSIVADRADELFFGNDLHRGLHVRRKPLLRGHRAGRSSGIVLVVVHDDDAVGGCGDGRVVVILVAHLHADV